MDPAFAVTEGVWPSRQQPAIAPLTKFAHCYDRCDAGSVMATKSGCARIAAAPGQAGSFHDWPVPVRTAYADEPQGRAPESRGAR